MLETANIVKNPIDIVYLWCDGTDPVFQKRKQRYVPQNIAEELGGKCHYVQYDELKYSLRSLEKHASWINHVYIVTDEQTPSWLNSINPKITIVDLKEILPPEVLPTFNTEVIETAIHKIPNLSEFFLYANDDMFFGTDTKPEFFFTQEGFPIIRGDGDILKKCAVKKYDILNEYTVDNVYTSNVLQSSFVVWKKTGDTLLYIPHHNFDAYRKSFFEEAELLFSKERDELIKKRFRGRNVNLRIMVQCLDYVKGRGVFKQVESYQLSLKRQLRNVFSLWVETSDSFYFNINNLTWYHKNLIKNGKYVIFCLNDAPSASDRDRAAVRNFLEDLFPQRSSFEV